MVSRARSGAHTSRVFLDLPPRLKRANSVVRTVSLICSHALLCLPKSYTDPSRRAFVRVLRQFYADDCISYHDSATPQYLPFHPPSTGLCATPHHFMLSKHSCCTTVLVVFVDAAVALCYQCGTPFLPHFHTPLYPDQLSVRRFYRPLLLET